MRSYLKIIFVAISIIVISCDDDYVQYQDNKPDYSSIYYWAYCPSQIEKNVDVFYVYPTLFGGRENNNMDITDTKMRSLVQAVIPKQAGVFVDYCNVFVPYYRQMSLDGLTMDEEQRNQYFSIGLTDVEQAFDFYINNLNNGRPFIIAGHSQGSQVIIELMKSKFGDDEVFHKLVAAYIIGYSVTDEDLAECEWLKIAEAEDDIGVIITYNTQSESVTGSPVLLPNANCVNPLNWKTTSEYAQKELNLGAVFFKGNGEIDSIVGQFTDAWIDDNGALVTGTPNVNAYSSDIFPIGVYHMYDYSFFFNNLKENVGVRIETYFN